jgi:hypothetical protein
MRAIRRTWAGPDVIFYSGDARKRELRGDELRLPVPDDLPNTGRKTLAAFEWVLQKRDAELVFRTNCSSYVDLPNLARYVGERAQTAQFYAGNVGAHGDVSFASGAGYFVSRDLIELAVRERARWNHEVLDDVALAELLHGHGITPQPAPRQDLYGVADLEQLDLSQFHFRCKTDSPRRRGDALLLDGIHRAFCRLRGRPTPLPVRLRLAAARLSRAA